jgi:D-alanine-D-alanine ligase
MKKQTIAILCGGQSAEHEVSLLSASNVIRDLDAERFEKIIVYITKNGRWLLVDDQVAFLEQAKNRVSDTSSLQQVVLQPGMPTKPLINLESGQAISVDCVFPVLHGACGEDGTMQGLLQILNVPYVGCDTISSAVCMEKHIIKQLLRHAGIPTLDWIALHRSEKDLLSYKQVAQQLGSVIFMKTVASGSSIGVYKVRNEKEYEDALAVIFNYDDNIIIEKGVTARELEVSVLGNNDIATTAPGEVLVYADFYTYEAKYFDPAASKVVTPAEVSDELSEQLQAYAAKAFRALRCKGMARIDFLVVGEDEIYLNEINPLPGFTNISMYPKSWAASGVSYKDLLSRLVEVAYEAHASREQIQHSIENFVMVKKEQQSAV